MNNEADRISRWKDAGDQMAGIAPVLLIGDASLREAVGHALPAADVVAVDHPLSGIWQFSRRSFERIILGYEGGAHFPLAIRALRQLAPHARIVIACGPTAEPFMRPAIDAGADDYVLAPIVGDELLRALRWPPTGHAPIASTVGPTLDEFVQLSQVLRSLHEGPARTLERMASIVKQAFGASGVVAQFEQFSCTVGTVDQIVLEEPIRSRDAMIGRIALAPSERGIYDSAAAARLGEYAALIETYVSQSRDQEHWKQLAWTDDLTGLSNRRHFEKVFDDLLARAAAQRSRVTLLLFDIDGFKQYNDRFGHEVGDGVLRELAELLRQCSRKGDQLARYGGDEFAVVFWDSEKPRVAGSSHPAAPIALAERFARAIASHHFRCLGMNAPGRVTISGGLASFPWDGTSRDALLRAADTALRAAKMSGKNQIALTGVQSQPRVPLDSGEDASAVDPPR